MEKIVINTTPSQPIGIDGQYLGASLKKCSKCSEDKPLDDFCKLSRSKDGRYPSCKSCEALVSRRYYENNREKVKAGVRKYASENPEKISERSRVKYQKDPKGNTAKSTAYARAHKEQSNAHKQKWLETNPEKRRESAKKWYDENRDYASERHKEKYASNPEKYLAIAKAWQARNREHVSMVARAWRHANPDKARATVRRRRLRMNTPNWADSKSILAVYTEAVRLAEETGVYHEVDHLYPIQGKTVSGLHVAANLQAIPCAHNRSKANKLPGSEAHELWAPNARGVYYQKEEKYAGRT